MGLQIDIAQAKAPRKPVPVYFPGKHGEGANSLEFSKRVDRKEQRAPKLTVVPKQAGPLRAVLSVQKPTDHTPSIPARKDIRSAQTLEYQNIGALSTIAGPLPEKILPLRPGSERSSSEDGSVNIDTRQSLPPDVKLPDALSDHGSTNVDTQQFLSEEVNMSSVAFQGHSKAETSGPAEVALTVLLDAEEANGTAKSVSQEDFQAPSCCRDPHILVAIHSTSIVILVALGIVLPLVPAVVFWILLVVLLLVHVIEGYYSESFVCMKDSMSSAGAVMLIGQLEAAPPEILLHLGTGASGRLKIKSWKTTSTSTPVFPQLALTALKVVGDYSVEDESSASYHAQINCFRTMHHSNTNEAVRE